MAAERHAAPSSGTRGRSSTSVGRSVRKGLLPVREPLAKTGTIEYLVRSVIHDLEAIRDVAQVHGVTATVLIQPFIRERPTADVLRTICDYYSSGTFRRCGVNWYEAAEKYVDLFTSVRLEVE